MRKLTFFVAFLVFLTPALSLAEDFQLQTSVPLDVYVESFPGILSVIVPSNSVSGPITFTATGFIPGSTYYKYLDDYHNLELVTADDAGNIIWEQDVSVDHLITIQDRPSTKFIRNDATGGDCNSIGVWDFGSKTCTLTQDINETIQIDSNGITLDGGGMTLGSGGGVASIRAVFASGKTNVAIKNIKTTGFASGIFFFNTDNSIVETNTINALGKNGVEITSGSTGNILRKNMIGPATNGIRVIASSANRIEENTLTSIRVQALEVRDSSQTVIINNTLSGLTEVTSNGTWLVGDGNTNEVKENSYDGFSNGIVLSGVNSIQGSDTVVDNIITNTLTTNIDLGAVSTTTVRGNKINSGRRGITLRGFGTTDKVQSNIISKNLISNQTEVGILLQGGTITSTCRNNTIYNNDFINNASQASVNACESSNAFNLPMPEGGNYWSDFDAAAEGCNDTDANNFCDAPKTFSGGADNLPSKKPFTQAAPKRVDPVIIIPGILGSWQHNGEWQIDPVLHTYDNLIETLDENYYTPGTDLFTFPYDWRESNIITALKLQDKIAEVKQICACDKVDLVAHSMGGLVARQYIQSGHYQDDVDQLIFLATPHLGSPKAYVIWEAGTLPEQDFFDRVFQNTLENQGKKLGFDDLFAYIRNYPMNSVQQLLSTQNYIKQDSSGVIRTYPANYPANSFLDNLNNGVTDLLSKVSVTNIIGNLANQTINTIRVVPSINLPLWEHGYPENFDNNNTDRGLEMGDGDVTVPLISSEFINSDKNYFQSSHRSIVTDSEGLVYKKLTDKDPENIINRGVINRYLDIYLFSPIDVVVTAPDGKRIGKNFETGEEINEIPGAFYSGFLTDDEYVTIPDPLEGEYKVEVKGTGSGEYTVANALISDSSSVENDFTANTELGLETTIKVQVFGSGLEVAPEDSVGPLITIISPEPRDYIHYDTFNIEVSSTDGSGVLSQIIRLDGVEVASGDNVDLLTKPLGDHTLVVTATDYVGNISTKEVKFRSIMTLSGMLTELDKLFARGEIKTVGARDSLKSKVKDALVSKNWKKVLTSSFMKEVDYQMSKSRLTQKGYNILKEDYQWVINH